MRRFFNNFLTVNFCPLGHDTTDKLHLPLATDEHSVALKAEKTDQRADHPAHT